MVNPSGRSAVLAYALKKSPVVVQWMHSVPSVAPVASHPLLAQHLLTAAHPKLMSLASDHEYPLRR